MDTVLCTPAQLSAISAGIRLSEVKQEYSVQAFVSALRSM